MNNIRKSEINELVSDLKKRFDLCGKLITKTDLKKICRAENIKLNLIDFPAKGFYGISNGIKFIILDQSMNNRKFMSFAFHELGHHFLEHKLFSFDNLDKQKSELLKLDNEANYFADTFLYK